MAKSDRTKTENTCNNQDDLRFDFGNPRTAMSTTSFASASALAFDFDSEAGI